jgi:alpha-tubulin suppressor-like RCC1 family protein
LDELRTGAGTLAPAFSPQTSTYSLTLPSSAGALTLQPQLGASGTRLFTQAPGRPWQNFAPGATLAVGREHALAVKLDGSVVAWGSNAYGQLDVPAAALSGIVSVAVGDTHSLALRADGSVVAWGSNAQGQLNVPQDAQSGVIAIAAARDRSFALKAGGQLLVWGPSATPPSAFATNVAAIAAGSDHVVALKTNGTVEVWGNSSSAPVSASSGVIALAAYGGRSLALKNDGTVVAWGSASSALLDIPAAVRGAVGIAASRDRNFALLSDGSVYAWGDTGTGNELTPPAAASRDVVFVQAGESQAAALRRDGSLVVWGQSGSSLNTPPPAALTGLRLPIQAAISVPYGDSRLAVRALPAAVSEPVAVPLSSLRNRTLAVAGTNGFALRADGGAVRLGNSGLPLPTPEPSGLVALAAGPLHALGLKTDGSVTGWGSNSAGQLDTPADAVDLIAVAAGANHSVALRRDGRVVAWGGAIGGFNALPSGGDSGFVAIASSEASQNLFLRADGSVAYWGAPSTLATLPSGVAAGVVAIAINSTNGLALKSDGQLVIWGQSNAISGPVPPEATNLVSIALGGGHALALTSGGRVVAWGGNSAGQITVPEGATTGVVAIAASGNASYALKEDGSIVSWGNTLIPLAQPVTGVRTPPAVSDVSIVAPQDSGASRVPFAVSDGTLITLSPTGTPSQVGINAPAGLTNLVALAAGNTYVMGLRPQGEVLVWGTSSSDLLAVPSAARGDVVALAAGLYHTLALKRDGSVVAWGNNGSGATNVPSLNPDSSPSVTARHTFTAIAASENTSFGLRSDGRVVAWGSTSYNLSTIPSLALSEVVDIAAGPRHALARRRDGTVVAWGQDVGPQPVTYAPSPAVVAIAAQDGYSALLLGNGAVQVISYGTGASLNLSSVPVSAQSGVIALSAGRSRIAALKSDGSIVTWRGSTDISTATGPFLRAGSPGENLDIALVRPFPSPALATLALSTGALTPTFSPDNTAYAQEVPAHVAGLVLTPRSDAPLAALTVSVNGAPPRRFALGASLSGGSGFNVGIASDGGVKLWGSLGTNLLSVPAAALSNLASVAAGSQHALALKPDGTVHTWGVTTGPLASVPGSAANGVMAIDAGPSHSLALRRDGAVVAWGSGTAATTAIPALAQSGVAAIAAGSSHNLALRANGSVVAWGSTPTPPASVSSDVVAIAAGENFSLALKATGEVIGWGDAGSGPLAPPVTLGNRIVAIAAGRRHAMALRDDGTVIVWGTNSALNTVPVTTAGAVAVAAGTDHCSALLADGSVVTWGNAFSSTSTDSAIRLLPPANVRLALRTGANRIEITPTPDGGVPLAATPMIGGQYRDWFVDHLGRADSTPTRSGGFFGSTDLAIYAAPVASVAVGPVGEYGLRLDGSVVRITGATPPSELLYNYTGQESLRLRARQLVVSDSTALALLDNGSLRGWSSSTSSLPLPAAAQGTFLAVAAGSNHFLAVTTAGRVVTWSNNSLPASLEVPGNLGGGVVGVAAGENFSLALKADGSVSVWGQSYDPVVANRPTLTSVRAIAAGRQHALALKTDGSVSVWGANGNSQLNIPTAAQTGVVAIAAGPYHSLALKTDGSVIAWGYNVTAPAALRLLTAPPRTYTLTIARAAELPALARLSTSAGPVSPAFAQTTADYTQSVPYATSRLTLSGALAGRGQIQINLNGTGYVSAPTGSSLAMGDSFLVGIDRSGAVVAAGGGSSSQPPAVPVAAQSGIVSVVAGAQHILALRADGVPTTWSGPFATAPASVLAIPAAAQTDVVAISAYGANSLALKRDGTVVPWGQNSSLNSSAQNLGGNNTAIALGASHVLALKAAGSVVSSGSAPNPPLEAASGVTAIAAGDGFSLALKTDGSVLAWGYSSTLATVPLAARSGVVAIAAGHAHAVALRSDGTVVTWGSSIYSLDTVPGSALGRAVAIAAGGNSSAVLNSAGGVIPWGGITSSFFRAPLATPFTALRSLREGANRIELRLLDPESPAFSEAVLAAGSSFHLAVSPQGAVSIAPSASGGSAPGTLPTSAQSGIRGVYARGPRLLALQASGAVVPISGVTVPSPFRVSDVGLANFTPTRALAIGSSDTLALLADGRVTALSNPARVPASAQTDVNAIAANSNGLYFAVRADGRLVQWDSSSVLATNLPAATQTDVIAVAAANNHALVLKADGQLFAWNYTNPSAIDTFTQIPAAATHVVAITAADSHFFALRRDGRVVSWGTASSLQTTPSNVESGVVAITAGPEHALALLDTGELVAWGRTFTGSGTPSATGLTAPATGQTASYTLRVDRALGVPGLANLGASVGALTPAFAPDTLAYALPATPYTATTLPGLVRAPLGRIETRLGSEPFAVRLPGPTLAAAPGVVFAITPAGGVQAFGDSLSSGNIDVVPVAAQSDVLAIATGISHAVVLKRDGSLFAWGNNSFGQLTVPEGNDFVAIAAGDYHSLALTSSGRVVAWGQNFAQQLLVPATAIDVVAIAAGENTSMALRRDGSVVAWGRGSSMPQTIPADAQSGVIAIAAGRNHYLALRADGRVVEWGSLTYPSGLAPTHGIVAIVAHRDQNLALHADGRLLDWGGGSSMPPRIPVDTPADLATLAMNDTHAAALRADGSLFVFDRGGPNLSQFNTTANFAGPFALPLGARQPLALGANTLDLRFTRYDAALPAVTYSILVERVPTPSIRIGAGSGANLAAANPFIHDFGSALVGIASAPQNFTLRNTGTADLIVNGFSVTSAPADGFAVSGLTPPFTLAPGAELPFTVSATPGATGYRFGFLVLDANVPPRSTEGFTFRVEGLALANEISTWLSGRFSAEQLADPALEATVWGDLADPDGNGVPNLLEYALAIPAGSDGSAAATTVLAEEPAAPDAPPTLRLTYQRSRRAAAAGLLYRVESSATLDGDSWAALTGNETILGITGDTETVAVEVPADTPTKFLRLRVTRPATP